MKFKSTIMDEAAVRRSLIRITHEIIEKNSGGADLVLLGIYRRGMPLAAMLRDNLQKCEGREIPLGRIDVSLYRDDLTEISDPPRTGECDIPFSLSGKKVVLVDDVIYTGRTVRAAIEAIFHHGRPRAIQLAVLIDRGHRELPIRPDYVGKNIPTSHAEVVSVMVDEFDGQTGVALYQIEGETAKKTVYKPSIV
ncbi:MAG: bifunctional pyr operon transcriptional regulator/uracil phosphoribosyltransferase PyrR [Clostridia bacterium]|nr:bifunctional pyr operon transcriptional regulator/uracil phosphoribosyltransferase PyrR [Clostridia bacterium]